MPSECFLVASAHLRILTPKIPYESFWDNLGFCFFGCQCFLDAAMCATWTQHLVYLLGILLLLSPPLGPTRANYSLPDVPDHGAYMSHRVQVISKTIEKHREPLGSRVPEPQWLAPASHTYAALRFQRHPSRFQRPALMQHCGSSAALVGSNATLLYRVTFPATHCSAPAPHSLQHCGASGPGGFNRLRFVGAANVSNQIPRVQSAPSPIPATWSDNVS